MSSRSRSFHPAAVVAFAACLTAASARAAPDLDPVAELRARQDRLQSLDFALREAQLLSQLCALRPANTECGGLPAGPADPADPDRAVVFATPRVIEIYGSNGQLRAVLLDGRGDRQVVRSGSHLDAETRVERIGRDFVTLKQAGKPVTLLLGN